MKQSKGKHGGKRKGSGRKRKYNEPTKPMRVPMSLVSHVVGLIKKGMILNWMTWNWTTENKKFIYPDFKNDSPELQCKPSGSIFWNCPNCNQATDARDWLLCCCQSCLKQWMDKNKTIKE